MKIQKYTSAFLKFIGSVIDTTPTKLCQKTGHKYGPKYSGSTRWMDPEEMFHILNWTAKKCSVCGAEKMIKTTSYTYDHLGRVQAAAEVDCV